MEKRVQELILKFNTQQLNADEQREIEKLVESGAIDLSELESVTTLQNAFDRIEYPQPSQDMDDRFYQMLALEKKSGRSFSWDGFFSWSFLAPKLAIASVTLLIGFAAGYFLRPSSGSNSVEMTALTQQVTDLKEMMLLSLLEKESATDRLKAVSLTNDLDQASVKVTGALLQTLNEDENVNVRLAALDALKPYAKSGAVREELIRSIARQESPLVQVALAEMMAELQVKSSVKEFEKILQSEQTPADVKKKIKESIQILI
jgi:hypothetical protein